MSKHLYLLQTKELGSFYIIAEDSAKAETLLKEKLREADYGFSDARKVHTISILASELTEFPKGKPNFSSGNKLIIPDPLTQ